MTTEQTTLIAAVIAAVAATLQIVLSAITSRNSEFRAAHRRILEPYIQDIGRSIHQILASSKMYLKRYGKQQSLDNWRSRAEDAVHRLKEIRWKVRYPLWGIDEGLRVITRVFHWVSHLQDYPDNAEKLFKAGDNLRKALDEAIKNS